MLGSVHDAEDALQETLLRAWRGLAGFEGAQLAADLALPDRDQRLPRRDRAAAASACCRSTARRRARRRPGDAARESVWLEPYPDEHLGLADGYAAPEARYEQRESVELAFIAALQHLPAHQRAALILREVLGLLGARGRRVARHDRRLGQQRAAARARGPSTSALPERSQQATLRALGDERMREVVERYVAAWERGDVDALLAMLAEDATFSMPPLPHWWSGREGVMDFIVCTGLPWLRHVVTRAGGQPAVAWYIRGPGRADLPARLARGAGARGGAREGDHRVRRPAAVSLFRAACRAGLNRCVRAAARRHPAQASRRFAWSSAVIRSM